MLASAIIVAFLLVGNLAVGASPIEGAPDDESTNRSPSGFRIVVPRGRHLTALSFGSQRTPTAKWDGQKRSLEIGVQLTNRFGIDLKLGDLSPDDLLTVSITMRSTENETTSITRATCVGVTAALCPVSLAALQVGGHYALTVSASWKSTSEVDLTFHEKLLPTQDIHFDLSHSRTAGSVAFTTLPLYMLVGSLYGMQVDMLDDQGASLRGVLTPWEGQPIVVEAWLGHSHRTLATSTIRNSTAVFSGVSVTLRETQSMMLVARVAAFQASPTSLTVYKCSDHTPGTLLSLSATSSSGEREESPATFGDGIQYLHHASGFVARILAPRSTAELRPPNVPSYICEFGSTSNSISSATELRTLRPAQDTAWNQRALSPSPVRKGTSRVSLVRGREVDPCVVECSFPSHTLWMPIVKSNLTLVQYQAELSGRLDVNRILFNVTQVSFSAK